MVQSGLRTLDETSPNCMWSSTREPREPSGHHLLLGRGPSYWFRARYANQSLRRPAAREGFAQNPGRGSPSCVPAVLQISLASDAGAERRLKGRSGASQARIGKEIG